MASASTATTLPSATPTTSSTTTTTTTATTTQAKSPLPSPPLSPATTSSSHPSQPSSKLSKSSRASSNNNSMSSLSDMLADHHHPQSSKSVGGGGSTTATTRPTPTTASTKPAAAAAADHDHDGLSDLSSVVGHPDAAAEPPKRSATPLSLPRSLEAMTGPTKDLISPRSSLRKRPSDSEPPSPMLVGVAAKPKEQIKDDHSDSDLSLDMSDVSGLSGIASKPSSAPAAKRATPQLLQTDSTSAGNNKSDPAKHAGAGAKSSRDLYIDQLSQLKTLVIEYMDLSSWLKNTKQKGPVTDETLRVQARSKLKRFFKLKKLVRKKADSVQEMKERLMSTL